MYEFYILATETFRRGYVCYFTLTETEKKKVKKQLNLLKLKLEVNLEAEERFRPAGLSLESLA